MNSAWLRHKGTEILEMSSSTVPEMIAAIMITTRSMRSPDLNSILNDAPFIEPYSRVDMYQVCSRKRDLE